MDALSVQEFEVGQRIDIINNNKGFIESLVANIYKEYFVIRIDNACNRVFTSNTNIEYICSFGSMAYRLNSNILGAKRDNLGQILILSTPLILAKVERRQYTRLPILIEVDYAFLPESEMVTDINKVSDVYFKRAKRTFTIDISGGGTKVITYENSQVGKAAVISMFIKQEIKALCKVIRVEEDSEKENFRTALNFESIDESKRKLIIDFIKEKSKTKTKTM